MSYWITSLLALAALQTICASQYHKVDFRSVEDIEEDDSHVDIKDYRYKTMNSGWMGAIKCTKHMCCPRGYMCAGGYKCLNLFRNWRQPMIKCPDGVELTMQTPFTEKQKLV